jgi:hypothetical protein
MNLLRTLLFFGLLLSLFWVFGLIVAYKRMVPDASRILPTLESPDAKIDTVVLKKGTPKAGEPIVLKRENDTWYLKEEGQKIKLEGFKVDGLIGQVKRAQKSEAFPGSDDPSAYGLSPPQLSVILKGQFKGHDKEWTLFLGKESPDKLLVYANSSERSDKVYAVTRDSVDSLFKDTSALRPRRLFDFSEASANRIDLKKGKDEVELKMGDDRHWRFEKPPLGFAGFEGTPSPTDPGGDPAKAGAGGGVKGLLSAISGMHVDADDDFVPAGSALGRFDLEEGKESLRIEVATAGSGEKKEGKSEVVLIGKKVPQSDKYYARVLGDDGVVQIGAKQLEPLEKALTEPGKIRSRDLSAVDPKTADYVILSQGSKEIKLFRPDEKPDWKLQVGKAAVQKASAKAMTALLEMVQGRSTILQFDDPPKDEQKKYDEQWGLDKPAAVVTVYSGSFDKESKDKEGKDKESKDKETIPTLKKDAKPAVTLAFGKLDGETIHVKRTLADGTVSYVQLVKTVREKLEPEEGIALAYLDPTVPGPEPNQVTEIDLQRGAEKLTLVRQGSDLEPRWYIKDPQEPSGLRAADLGRVSTLIGALHNLQVRKWVEKIDAKTDLDKHGLKSSELSASLIARSERLPPAGVASFVALLGTPIELQVVSATTAALAHHKADRGEITTIRFGKESDEGHFKSTVYARSSSSDVIFLVAPEVVKLVRDSDPRDRSVLLNTEPALLTGAIAGAMGAPEGGWLLASPLVTGSLSNLDPAKVKELKISLRTSAELRTFTFRRADKTWLDVSGLQEFQLDGERVNQVVEKLARVRANRLVLLAGGPRSDQKLLPKEAPLRVELTDDAGRSVTLWVGGEFERQGYFANSSAWPEVVFLVPATTVEPILQGGIAYFSKERFAGR